VLLGLFGVFSHFSVARALTVVDASATAPFEFIRMPYAALLGYLCFSERPDAWTWIGGGIIIASALYVAHREARLARGASGGGRRPAPLSPG